MFKTVCDKHQRVSPPGMSTQDTSPKKAARIMLMLAIAFCSAGLMAQTLEIDGELYRDPTQPPGAVLADLPATEFEAAPRFNASSYRLKFIRSGGINPVAVINDRVVTIGDEIDQGVRISGIRAGVVVVEVEGQEHLLSLYNSPVRQDIQ